MLGPHAALWFTLLVVISSSSGGHGSGIVINYGAGVAGLETSPDCRWKHRWTHVLKQYTMSCVICSTGSLAVIYEANVPLATVDLQSCEDDYDVVVSITIPNQDTQNQHKIMLYTTDGKCTGVNYPSMNTFNCFRVKRGIWKFVRGYTNGWRRHRNNHLRSRKNTNPS